MPKKDHQQRYRVIDKIAAGGMAEVFRAESAGIEGFKKRVAIKRVLPHLSQKRQFISMFLDEARLCAQLTHSNVVQTFDIGIGDDTYFIVMEYVDGADLKAVIERFRSVDSPVPLEPAVYMALKMCEGLAYAHSLTDSHGKSFGIVHRDVSPPNVLITRYGEVKITDFGLAKANNQLEQSEPGIIKGKFSYLAPEAAMGEEVDARVDIFAVGIILWEMLAGRKLFAGSSDYQTVKLVQRAEIPPLRELNERVPAALEKVILKALARDRDQRYARASDLGKDLNQFLFKSGNPVGPWDIARLVRDTLAERKHQKPGSPNIINELIKQALFEFTSLGSGNASVSALGARSTPAGAIKTVEDGAVPDWASEIKINDAYVGAKLPERREQLLSKLEDIELGNLSALEDAPASILQTQTASTNDTAQAPQRDRISDPVPSSRRGARTSSAPAAWSASSASRISRPSGRPSRPSGHETAALAMRPESSPVVKRPGAAAVMMAIAIIVLVIGVGCLVIAYILIKGI